MARFSKTQSETKLPPLTTEQDHATNWHRSTTRQTPEAPALWSVTWDTSPHADAFNTAYHKTEEEAADCARRFLKLGFVVYSIKDATGTEVMDEAAVAERYSPRHF
jgi:hypothetical protein